MKRNINIPAIGLITALVFSTVSLWANEKGIKRKETAAGRTDVHMTVLFDLQLYDTARETGRDVEKILARRLKGLTYCKLIRKKGPCHDARCAVEMGGKAGADRVIYGYVSTKTDVEKNRLSDTGAKKYIIKIDKKVTLRITLKLIDSASGKELAAVTETAAPDDLERAAADLTAKLGPFFTPRQRETIPDESEEKQEEKQKEKPEKETKKKPVGFDLGAYFSFTIPVGTFGNISSFSLGNTLEGRVRNLFFNHSELRLSAGYYYYSLVEGDVTSYRSLYTALYAGYRFEIMPWFSLTPLLGGGCHVHFIKNRYSGDRIFGDPLIGVRLGFDFHIYKGLSLSLAPGYMVFFERSNTGMYPVIEAGLVYSF